MAVREFQGSDRSQGDFWVAILSSRNTWGNEPRGTFPVTSFGPTEYWAEMHFSGPLSGVTADISEWISRDRVSYPDSDPARIVMVNISTADRRLRERASQMGFEIVGNQFVS
jgi:hypothetical protein